MKRLLLACALLLCAPLTTWSATYEDTFTPKANRAYNEDINVWVYTSEFAKRFGMPEKWVDDDLSGAYAVAFRVETSSARLMFPHKGRNVAMPQRDCVLDVYLPSSARIPWLDERIADFKFYTPDSAAYLAPQSPEDRHWRRRPVGMPYWGNAGVNFGTGKENLGGFPVREYDKQVYPGITYISFAKSCMTPPKTASWIEFRDYSPRNSEKPLWKYREMGVTHRIYIPASFMKRLYDDWHRNSRRPAKGEWNHAIQGK